jgi:outer membrane usher protein
MIILRNKQYRLQLKNILLALSSVPHFVISNDALAIEFNQNFIQKSENSNIDLKYFEQGEGVAPGTYSADILINSALWKRQDVTFLEMSDGSVRPEVNIGMLREMGIDLYKLEKDSILPPFLDEDATIDITLIPGATANFDVNSLELNFSIPQIYVSRQSQSVDPSLWDEGITALYSNYQTNISRNINDDRKSDYGYIGLRNGLNIGAWRLRNESSITTGTEQTTKFNSNRTYAERDISSLKSTLSLGELYSAGNIFDSVQFRGFQLGTETAMLASNEVSFAPTIYGIAETNANIEVRQNGNLIYSTSVPPGAFEITDLYPSGSNGDLEVTIIESDGQKRTFTQPYAFLPVMVSKGQKRYSLAAGEYSNSDIASPAFMQGTFTYGLNNTVTAFGGLVAAEDYQAQNIGVGLNTPIGGISLDVTNSQSTTPDEKKKGQSARFLYSKTFNKTDTAFTMVGYRYSTENYRSFSQHIEDLDQVNRTSYGKQKNRLDIHVNQSLGKHGSLFISAGETSYWNTTGRTRNYQAGYNTGFFDGNFSLSVSRTENAGSYQDSDTQLAATFSIPLGSTARSARIYSSVVGSENGGNSVQTGISGSLDKDNNINYSAQTTYSDSNDLSGGVGLSWRTPYADLSGNFSQSANSTHYNFSATGAIVAHKNGVTFGPAVGETFSLVEIPGVKGVGIDSSSPAKTDSSGFVIANYVQPYRRNWINLNTSTLGSDVEFEDTSMQVIPRRGAIVHARFNAESGRRVQFELSLKNGEKVPMGAVAVDQDGKSLGVVDNMSRLLVFGIKDKGSIVLEWKKNSCTAEYELPEKDPETFYTREKVSCL